MYIYTFTTHKTQHNRSPSRQTTPTSNKGTIARRSARQRPCCAPSCHLPTPSSSASSSLLVCRATMTTMTTMTTTTTSPSSPSTSSSSSSLALMSSRARCRSRRAANRVHCDDALRRRSLPRSSSRAQRLRPARAPTTRLARRLARP